MSESRVWSSRTDQADDLVAMCKAQSALVDAALKALDEMTVPLERLVVDLDAAPGRPLIGHVDHLYSLVESAAIGADNLLAAPFRASGKSFMFRAIGRQASGSIDLRTIEVDRDALALTAPSGAGESRALDRLADTIKEIAAATADRAAAKDAANHMSAQVGRCISRLSLFKARLDLQESFLSSVVDADPASPCVRLENHLNHTAARDLAQETRRLLSGKSLAIAIGNRRVLTSLLDTGPVDKT